MTNQTKLRHFLVVSTLLAALIAFAPALASEVAKAADGRSLDPNTQFYVAKPNHGALEQIANLTSSGDKADAGLIGDMIATPQAVWFTSGTPKSIQQDVKNTVQRAADKGTVPVVVAYNVPGRDCSQYSAGGAATGDAYKAWIDGFAAGLGNQKAVVILEPDGLALLPTDCGQPDTYDRVGLINYAAHALLRDPNAAIYLDAGHSAWHSVGDIAARLVAGGVQDVQGFFQNASNYQFTTNSVQYGTWVSKCIAYATTVNSGDFGGCPNQYWNGGPLPAKIAQLLGEWTGVALSPYGEWSDGTDVASLNTSGINLRYANMLGATQPTTHFVIDTSRNGQGPWSPPAHPAGDPQDWCNPPDRGLGEPPTANTGQSLVDAYLWVKIPGESDGQCYRWTSGPLDPVRLI
ncbi:MAG TPA: glycoside hydrolase family 6 protein, partial [Roseiflexaceae bacterium]